MNLSHSFISNKSVIIVVDLVFCAYFCFFVLQSTLVISTSVISKKKSGPCYNTEI